MEEMSNKIPINNECNHINEINKNSIITFKEEVNNLKLNDTKKEENIKNCKTLLNNNFQNSNEKINFTGKKSFKNYDSKTDVKKAFKDKNNSFYKSNNKLNNIEKTPIGKFKIDDDDNDNYNINEKSGKKFWSNIKNGRKNLTSNKKKDMAFNLNSNLKNDKEDQNIINNLNFETEQQIVDVNHFSNKSFKNFIFETPINNINQNEDVHLSKNINDISNFENVEISEFFSRYNTLEKGSNFLSHKRRRELLIKESYDAFGFSFDSGINLKKGFSKVEKEKLLEKQKRESLIENQINIQDNIEINSTLDKKISKHFNHESYNSQNSSSFMQDAIVKKCRVERDKEKFLEEQKKLKELENCKNNEIINSDNKINKDINIIINNTYLSFKERKQALLNSSNSDWGEFMTQNIKKKSRVEVEKEKFLEEKQKLNTTLLKIKNSEIKSQVFKFDMCDLSSNFKKKENSARKL